MKNPKSKFLKVRCSKCNNEQIVFDHSATVVKCLICDSVLVEPKSGKSEIKGQILEVLD